MQGKMKVKDYRISDHKKSARMKGTVIHVSYRKPYKSWHRHVLLSKLDRVIEGRVFSRRMENVRLVGVPDDYETDGVNVSIVEVFTTVAAVASRRAIERKTLQLQEYVWVMTPILMKLGYKVASMHWLEVYNQDTREQLERIMVEQRDDIEDIIREKILGKHER